MSADQLDILGGIKLKVQSVKSRLQEQLDEIESLKASNNNLREELQQKQLLIDKLEEKGRKLSLVKGIGADGEQSQEAKVQINKIVREIDKCIALLNK